MGIPSYFKNIISDYNNILIQQDLFNININNLFFDLNCLIHPACQGLTDEQEMFNNIYNNMIKIINISNPSDLIILLLMVFVRDLKFNNKDIEDLNQLMNIKYGIQMPYHQELNL